jgi:hypothetical protein
LMFKIVHLLDLLVHKHWLIFIALRFYKTIIYGLKNKIIKNRLISFSKGIFQNNGIIILITIMKR